MKRILVAIAVLCMAMPALADNILEYELDGVSDPANLVGIVGVSQTSYLEEGGEGYTEMLLEGNNWYVGRIELPEPLDLTPGLVGGTVAFDGRYYNDPLTNTDPYADAPIAVRFVSYDANNLRYTLTLEWPFGPTGDADLWPEWVHVEVALDDPGWVQGWWSDDGAVWTPSNVTEIEFYGTDWFGTGDDHVDLKNLVITPEPSALALLALGGVALLRRR
jgi:hypothetical protein